MALVVVQLILRNVVAKAHDTAMLFRGVAEDLLDEGWLNQESLGRAEERLTFGPTLSSKIRWHKARTDDIVEVPTMPPERRSRSASTLISVVIPSLNSGAYIGKALESVLSQFPEDIEVIVQDGGSTDQTATVVRSLSDKRIEYTQEPDSGQADALNRAVRRASGRWILWLNADDMLANGAFDAISPFLDGPDDVVYGDFCAVDEAGRTLKAYRSGREISREHLLRRGCYVFSGTMFFRREVFERLGLFDSSRHFVMDYEFLLRIAPHVKAVHSGAIVGQFRIQPASKTSKQAWGFFHEGLLVRWRYGGFSLSFVALTALRAAYLTTRPVWQTRLWRSVRPTKRL